MFDREKWDESLKFINRVSTGIPAPKEASTLAENQQTTPPETEEQLSGIDWTKLSEEDRTLAVASLVEHLQDLGYEIDENTAMPDVYQLVADDPDLEQEADFLTDLGILEWVTNPETKEGLIESMANDPEFKRLSGLHLKEAAPGAAVEPAPKAGLQARRKMVAKKREVKPEFKAPPPKAAPSKAAVSELPAKNRFSRPEKKEEPKAIPQQAGPAPKAADAPGGDTAGKAPGAKPQEPSLKDKVVSKIKGSWAGRLAMKAGVGNFSKDEKKKLHKDEHDEHDAKQTFHQKSADDAGERMKLLHGQVRAAEKEGRTKHATALRSLHAKAVGDYEHHIGKVSHHKTKKDLVKRRLADLDENRVDSDAWAAIVWTLAENYEMPDDITTAEIAELIQSEEELKGIAQDPQFEALFKDAATNPRSAEQVLAEAEDTFHLVASVGTVVDAWNALNGELTEEDLGEDEDLELAEALDGLVELVSELDDRKFDIPLDSSLEAFFESIEATPELADIYESEDYALIVEGVLKKLAKHGYNALKTGAKLAGAAALVGATGGTAALLGGAGALAHLAHKGGKAIDKGVKRWANDDKIKKKKASVQRDDDDDDDDDDKQAADREAYHRHRARLVSKVAKHQANIDRAHKELGTQNQYQQYAQLN